MAIETDADRAIFVSTDDFGVSATWRVGAVVHGPFDCIFDDTFTALTAGALEFEQEGGALKIEMRTSDVPSGGRQDDLVTIASKNFKVLEFRDDGTGMTVVRLMEE